MKASTTPKADYKKYIYKALAVAFWIVVWEAVACAVGGELPDESFYHTES